MASTSLACSTRGARAAVLALLTFTSACASSSSNAPPDPTAPIVVETDPASGANGVSVVPTVAITFDQPMTTTAGTVEVAAGGAPQVLAELAWTAEDTRLEIGLVESLPAETPVTVTLQTDFRSAAGLGMAERFRLSFRTGADEDPPGVLTSTPSEGQVDVDVDRLEEVRVTFDEDMTTTTIQARFLFDDEVETVFGSWDDDDRTVRFPVEVDLPNETPIGLDLSILEDLAGNHPGPGASGDDAVLDFTSGPDVFEPFVQNATPREGAIGVGLDLDEISVVFSEAMDTSVTEFALVADDDDAAPPIPLTGTWESDDLVLILPIPTSGLRAQTSYHLDLRSARDVRGNMVPDDEAFTEDGILDFRTTEATGESCRDALDTENAELVDGTLIFALPATPVGATEGILDADGGAESCNPEGPGPDAVIRYTKTTASLSDGGSLLRVSARPAGGFGGPPLALEVVRGDCAPAAERLAEEQVYCTAGRHRWDAHLDVGPGTYFIFVSPSFPTFGFPATTVEIDELTDAGVIEGESCAAPFTTDSDIHSMLVAGVDRWVIPANRVEGFDMDRSWGGEGVLTCVDDFRWGDRPGVDAVIEIDKADPASLLQITVSSFVPVVWGLFEGSCDDATRTPVGCVNPATGAVSRFDGAIGLSGPLQIWIAAEDPVVSLGGLTVEVEEITPLPAGAACGRGISLATGDNPIEAEATERFGAPSCFSGTSEVLWYEYTLEEEAVAVDAVGDGAIALVDPRGQEALSCVSGTDPSLGQILDVGDTICVAVEGGSGITSLRVSDVDYDGPGAAGVRRVAFEAPSGATGPSLFEEWLATDGDRAWIGARVSGVSTLLEVDLETGVVTERDEGDDIDPNGFGNDGVVVGSGLFTLSALVGSGTPRLTRVWDGMSSPWTSTSWDTDPSYPVLPALDVAHDGSDFLVLVRDTSLRVYSVPGGGGSPTELTDELPAVDRADQFAVDDTYLYTAVFSGTRGTVERVPRSGLGDAGTLPTAMPAPFLAGFDPILVTDGGGDPRYLFVRGRSPGGVHVIEDPGSDSPRYLGVLWRGANLDAGLDYDPGTGQLVLVDTLEGGSGRPELVVFE